MSVCYRVCGLRRVFSVEVNLKVRTQSGTFQKSFGAHCGRFEVTMGSLPSAHWEVSWSTESGRSYGACVLRHWQLSLHVLERSLEPPQKKLELLDCLSERPCVRLQSQPSPAFQVCEGGCLGLSRSFRWKPPGILGQHRVEQADSAVVPYSVNCSHCQLVNKGSFSTQQQITGHLSLAHFQDFDWFSGFSMRFPRFYFLNFNMMSQDP